MIFQVDEKLPSCHACTLAQLKDGSILASWYAGTAEKEPDVNIFGARLEVGAEEWSGFFPMIEDEKYSLGNPVLFMGTDGKLFLFWGKMMGDRDWQTCSLFWRESSDGGRTWGPDRVLREELGCMIKYPPTVLDTGEYLLPLYHEIEGTTEWYLSADKGKSWSFLSKIVSTKPMNAQANAVQLGDRSLLAYMRCIKHGTDIRAVIRSTSTDLGRTWTRGEPMDNLPNPDSAIRLMGLRSGRLMIVYNNSTKGRSPLTVAVSDDGGGTWRNAFDLEAGEGSYAYPHAIQAVDGTIHAAYSFHRDGIKHVSLTEDELG